MEILFKKHADKFYYLLVCIYLFFLLLDFKIVNIAMPLVFVLSFIHFKEGLNDLKGFYKKNKNIVWILISFILFQFIRALLADDLGDKRIGFLGLLLASFFVLFRMKKMKFIFNSIILAITILVFAGGYNIYKYYISSEEFNMIGGGHIDPMLIVARPYLGYVLNIGIILLSYLAFQIKEKKRYIYMLLALLFVSYMMFIAIRIQLVSLFCIVIMYFVFYNKLKIAYKLGLFLSLIIVGTFLFSTSSTLQERFEIKTLLNENVVEKLAQKEPRVVIWSCAKSIAQEENFNKVIGIGDKKVIDSKLATCYDLSTKNNPMRDYFLDALFNTHNQFVEYYLLSGIIGLSLFLSLFFNIGIVIRRNFHSIALLVCLFNFCLVENLMDRQLGAYLIGLTLFLALKINELKTLDMNKILTSSKITIQD